MSNEQLIAISVDEYERARLCVNACRGASDEWLRAWSKLENPGMSLSESLQYWITRHCEEAEKRAALEKALSATVAQRDEYHRASQVLGVERIKLEHQRDELLAALAKAREDINWMINSEQQLNSFVFDYIDAAIANVKGADHV